jgi:hypothetical protein
MFEATGGSGDKFELQEFDGFWNSGEEGRYIVFDIIVSEVVRFVLKTMGPSMTISDNRLFRRSLSRVENRQASKRHVAMDEGCPLGLRGRRRRISRSVNEI